MNRREAERLNHQENTLRALGLSAAEAETLRRASMTLHRWAEHECNGTIQRDEETGKAYSVNPDSGRRWPVADRETGALKRARAIAEKHGLTLYHQADPRGAALYLLRPGDVPVGQDASAYYSRGVVVY